MGLAQQKLTLTSFRPRQNRSKTRFMLPPFSMEMTRVWSSSLIQIKKVFWWLCLGTGKCLAVLAACRDPLPTQLCPFCPCHCCTRAALGSHVLNAPVWAARGCSWRWASAHPHVSLLLMGAVSSALGTGGCQHGGDPARTGDRSMAPAPSRQWEGACEARSVH